MSIGLPPDRSDVVENGAAQGIVSVNGTAIELKAGANRLPGRQFLVIFNDGIAPVFTGPSASVSASGANKGMPLYTNHERTIPVGDVPIYAVTFGSTSVVLVQEFA